MQKVLMASLTALLMFAPVALAADSNVGPGMTGNNSSAGAGTTSTTTTTSKSGVSTKKSGKFNIFSKLHRQKQIRLHHRNRRLMRRRSVRRHGRR